MNRDNRITETRDWARIVFMAGLALALVILAVRGALSGSALAGAVSALGWMPG